MAIEIVDLPIKHGLWFVVDLPLWVIYCKYTVNDDGYYMVNDG